MTHCGSTELNLALISIPHNKPGYVFKRVAVKITPKSRLPMILIIGKRCFLLIELSQNVVYCIEFISGK
ncbi:MAG: hypothetical protein JWR02_2779 [Mucilaginibacter sp.]|nr:hypothetical protein [Mucilaginibacter sp.]